MSDDALRQQPDLGDAEHGSEAERSNAEGWARFAEARASRLEPTSPAPVTVLPVEDTEVTAAVEPPSAEVESGDLLDQPPPIRVSLWTRFFRPMRLTALRVIDLDRAIEAQPSAAANYVLRGESLLKLRRYGDAEMDFRRALELAAAQVESQDWGVVAQVVQDRALAGLKQARSYR
ncbi:MAG: hypothetical protein IAE80_20635 [Anaerolinea sp.]|nr:hypothetical protein [Anaerolinea sp.]